MVRKSDLQSARPPTPEQRSARVSGACARAAGEIHFGPAAADGHVRQCQETRELRAKTRLFAILSVLSNVAGNSALTKGMHQVGDPGNTPAALIGALFHPWVAIGVALLDRLDSDPHGASGVGPHLSLRNAGDCRQLRGDESSRQPDSFSGETVSLMRWGGIVLITSGVTLVGRTAVASGGSR